MFIQCRIWAMYFTALVFDKLKRIEPVKVASKAFDSHLFAPGFLD